MSRTSQLHGLISLIDEQKTDQGIIIVLLWAIALIAVGFRFLARRLTKAGLWYDDLLMIPAIVSIPHRLKR